MDILNEAMLQKIIKSKEPITLIHKPPQENYEDKFKGLEDKIGSMKPPDMSDQFDEMKKSITDNTNNNTMVDAFSTMIEKFLGAIKKLTQQAAPKPVIIKRPRQNTGMIKAFEGRIEKLTRSLEREKNRNRKRESEIEGAFEDKARRLENIAKRRRRPVIIAEPSPLNRTVRTFGTDN